jgi:DNA processing protein
MDKYLVALNRIEKLTPLRFKKLLSYFADDVERMWNSTISEWREAGIENNALSEIWEIKSEINPEKEFQKLQNIGGGVIGITNPKYPRLLKEIYDSPPVLLFLGEFPIAADDFAIGVVGTRVATSYGKQAASEISRGLAQAGITIVSGLAAGLDSVAHQAAVDMGKRTIAVFGCGLDTIYPPTNRNLAKAILDKGGCLLSEYPLGIKPTAYTFPKRNRIIAGLSRGVLVVEGREKSGSLITAQLANEFGREVFAIPGSIFSDVSAGPNRLIQQGAKPIISAADILESLEFTELSSKIEMRDVVADSPEEAKILTILKKTPLLADEITRESGFTANEASSILSLLEMKGLAKNLGGMQWVRS